MRKTAQINIRLTDQIDSDLNETAEALGVSKSALIRRVTELFLAEVKRTGAVKIRPEWLDGISPPDGRTGWGERVLPAEGDGTQAAEPDPDYPATDPKTEQDLTK